jgi:hypothetical protein
MLILDSGIRLELDAIMCLDQHDIHEDITSTSWKGKILNDEVNIAICVFDARDVDTPNLKKLAT